MMKIGYCKNNSSSTKHFPYKKNAESAPRTTLSSPSSLSGLSRSGHTQGEDMSSSSSDSRLGMHPSSNNEKDIKSKKLFGILNKLTIDIKNKMLEEGITRQEARSILEKKSVSPAYITVILNSINEDTYNKSEIIRCQKLESKVKQKMQSEGREAARIFLQKNGIGQINTHNFLKKFQNNSKE